MADLLTTSQVQDLLRVDRTTIYRMIEDGRLAALRVGKQWRFPKEDLERWLQTQVASVSRNEAPAAEGTGDAKPNSAPLSQVIPLSCSQLIQDAFAEMLGCMLVITDLEGRPVTEVSNPSGFFVGVSQQTAPGRLACQRTWQALGVNLSLEPKFAPNELGLLSARALIRQGSELKGMVIAGCIAPDNWPPDDGQIVNLAERLGVDSALLQGKCDAVYRLDQHERGRVLRFLQRIADVFSHMAEDRSLIQTRLQAIAKLTSL